MQQFLQHLLESTEFHFSLCNNYVTYFHHVTHIFSNFALGTISAPAQTLNSGDRKIGLEKVEITPFFGNEQQAFSMKSNAIASTPIRYQTQPQISELVRDFQLLTDRLWSMDHRPIQYFTQNIFCYLVIKQ